MDSCIRAYLRSLEEDADRFRVELGQIIVRHRVRPVGNGFIDIVTPVARAESFLSDVTELGIAVNVITLWCDCTDENRGKYGCPHGSGGPAHEVGSGYYSEMCESDPFEITEDDVDPSGTGLDPPKLVEISNNHALRYVRIGMKSRLEYSPCLVPGFWLRVPETWKST